MAASYLTIMEEHLGHLTFNAKLCKQLEHFMHDFITKNDDHVNFFGSNLTGVYKIVWSTMDTNDLFELLGEVDNLRIRREIKSLPDVGSTWTVATEPVTVCLMYIIHKYRTSNQPDRVIKDACLACSRIFHAKFISSLLSHYLPYGTTEEIALAVYRQMSRKYTIKQEGSWLKVIDRRSDDILYAQDTWKEQIDTFKPDDRMAQMFSDIQSRMRSIFKYITALTVAVSREKSGVGTDNIQIHTDEGLQILDVTRLQTTYTDYLLGVVKEPRAFIKTELVDIIHSAITTMPEGPLYDVLNYVSSESAKQNIKVETFLRETLIYVFEYLQEQGEGERGLNDTTKLISKLKALLTASKTSNSDVLKLRNDADRIVKKGTAVRNSSSLSGLRTGLILYVILRTFTKNHYQ